MNEQDATPAIFLAYSYKGELNLCAAPRYPSSPAGYMNNC